MGLRFSITPRPVALLVLLLAAAVLPGCVSELEGSVYVHPNADLGIYQRVAVLPLENLTNERFAAERVRDILNVELAALGLFEVVDSGEVNRVLAARDLRPESIPLLGPQALSEVAAELKVQGVLLGTVLEMGEQRTSTFSAPEVSISLRLIDAQSGTVAWSVTDARKGLPLGTRLFGVGEKSQTEVVRELVRELMAELYRAAGP